MAKDGKRVEALETRPTLMPGAEPYYIAFTRLHGSRIMGDGPIPLSEIDAYARFFGFDTLEERAWLFNLVTSCDRAWLKSKEPPSGNAGKHSQGWGGQQPDGGWVPAS